MNKLNYFLVVGFLQLLNGVFAQSPSISSFSPISAPIGAQVILTGSNFDPVAINNIVYFGATRANVSAATATSLTVTVPSGALHSNISVTSNGLMATSPLPFVPTFSFCGSPDVSASSWASIVNFNAGSISREVAIGDIDGDSKPDVITLGYTGGANDSLFIYKNQGNSGSITSSTFAPKVGYKTGGSSNHLVLSDLDRDGKLDILVTNGGFGTAWTFRVFHNTSTVGVINAGSLSAPIVFTLASPGYPKAAAIDDLDRDGKPDLVVATDDRIFVKRNVGTSGNLALSSFSSDAVFYSTLGATHLTIADIDGDGKKEVVAKLLNSGVAVFKNNSNAGSIFLAAPIIYSLAAGNGVGNLLCADLDQDNKIDIIHSNSIFRNTSTSGVINSSSFAPVVSFNGFAYLVGDLDGDTKPDIGGENVIFTNSATSGVINSSSFSTTDTVNCSGGPITLTGAISDLNADGLTDLVFGNQTGAVTLSVLERLGAVTVPTPDICMVTVDSLSQYNEIYWDKTLYPSMDSMIIWREVTSNVYKRIGAVHSSALSMYVDTARSIGPANGNPNLGTYRYKIQIRDVCGNLSQKSLWHNTVFFINSGGTFFWNEYKIEGTPTPTNPMTQFDLVRDDFAPTGNYNTVGTVAGTQTTLNDPFYVAYQNTADWRVFAYGLNCSPTMRLTSSGKENEIQTTIVKSKSNIKNTRTTGIKSDIINLNSKIKVYPNPASDLLNIVIEDLKGEVAISIENMLGQVVYSMQTNKPINSINTSNLNTGVYFVKVNAGKGIAVEKIIIE